MSECGGWVRPTAPSRGSGDAAVKSTHVQDEGRYMRNRNAVRDASLPIGLSTACNEVLLVIVPFLQAVVYA